MLSLGNCVRAARNWSLALLLFSTLTAHADTLGIDFGSKISTSITMDGSGCTLLLPCVGTLGYTVQPGGTSLYTPLGAIGSDDRLPRSFRNGPLTDTLLLTWSGSGTGTISSMLPLDWDFLATYGGAASNVRWQLSLTMNGTNVYTNGLNPLTASEVVGSEYVDTSALAGQSFNSWSLSLGLTFQANAPLSFVALAVPYGHTFDLGTDATVTPEPASLSLTGAALLGALMAVRRWRRR